MSNIETARQYLKLIESGEFGQLAELVAPDVIFEQLPNRIYPNGARAKLADAQAAFEKGRKLFSSQTYKIINHAANGNLLAMEVLWTGILAVAFGTLAVGSEMRAHCAMFLEFRSGQIVAQRNYDCFEPW